MSFAARGSSLWSSSSSSSSSRPPRGAPSASGRMSGPWPSTVLLGTQHRPRLVGTTFALACLAATTAGCGSSEPSGPAGGPAAGALDDHCAAVTPVVVNPASCTATPPTGGPEEEPPVHFNAESDDDDCKYHVSFTATPVRLNQDVTFKVTVTDLAGAKGPVTGADPHVEGTLNNAVPIANTNPKTTESPPGTYTIGPVKFPQAGRWVITYHLFESCMDLEDSPHGHASFYIDVP